MIVRSRVDTIRPKAIESVATTSDLSAITNAAAFQQRRSRLKLCHVINGRLQATSLRLSHSQLSNPRQTPCHTTRVPAVSSQPRTLATFLTIDTQPFRRRRFARRYLHRRQSAQQQSFNDNGCQCLRRQFDNSAYVLFEATNTTTLDSSASLRHPTSTQQTFCTTWIERQWQLCLRAG